ncbi:MAG: two-component system response regulator [Methylococcaceae bacterium]|nr:MAG: two-component system response regulator [Methylococcaceae bacterium]
MNPLHFSETREKRTILIVDDTPENLAVLHGLLKDNYKVKPAHCGARALQIAGTGTPPDLILLDIMMPEMDGYEVLRRLRADAATRDIPVIFLTAKTEPEEEEKGLKLGAVDYITKPISPSIVQARIQNHLELKAARDFLKNHNAFLEAEVCRRMQETLSTQDVAIRALASLAETRDNETGNHIRRTQGYVKALAEKVRGNPRFSEFLTDAHIDLLFKTAPLHDIGKVGIRDHILLKPAMLDPEEYEIMKTHTTIGRDAILKAEKDIGHNVEFLHLAKEMAYAHHEKWDGTGYPLGLAGDAIPLSARLMALADVYDALISWRIYKIGLPHEKAVEIIVQDKGSYFDPDLVDAFVEIQEEFRAIADRYFDDDVKMAHIARGELVDGTG